MSENKPGHGISLLKSFNPNFYRNIVNQSFGRSVVYIMLLSFVVSFLLAAKVKIGYNSFVSMSKVLIEKNLDNLWPKGLGEIKIEKGLVSSDTEQPYVSKWNDFVFILDTTGAVKSLNDYKYGILLIKDKIIVKREKSNYETRIEEYDLSRLGKFTIRQGDILKGVIADIKTKNKLFNVDMKLINFWMRFIGGIIFFAMLLFFFLFYITAKIIQGALFAMFAMLHNKISGANLNYAKLLNISLYALTFPTILAVIIMLAGGMFSNFWLVYSVIYMSYIILGIKNIKSNSIDENKSPFLSGGNNA